jgi:hypothetical protein
MTRSPENIMKQLNVEGKTGSVSISAQAAPALCARGPACPLFPGDSESTKGLLSEFHLLPLRFFLHK